MVIAIAVHKGGTGKTTTTLNLGAALARQGKRVLLVDLDAQCNLTSCFGIPEDSQKNVARWMLEEYSFEQVKQTGLGMDIIPSSYELTAREVDVLKEQGGEFLLKLSLKDIKKNYDYILLDCPPSLSIMTTNALAAANRYIIPILAASFSYKALDKMLQTVDKVKRRINEDLELAGVLFTQHSQHSRTILGKTIVEAVKEQVPVFETNIRTNKALDEAQNNQQDIYSYDSEATGAEDYMQLSKEVLALN